MNNLIEKDIDDFLFFLRYELNNTPKTRNKKLASLRGLFKFLTITIILIMILLEIINQLILVNDYQNT